MLDWIFLKANLIIPLSSLQANLLISSSNSKIDKKNAIFYDIDREIQIIKNVKIYLFSEQTVIVRIFLQIGHSTQFPQVLLKVKVSVFDGFSKQFLQKYR